VFFFFIIVIQTNNFWLFIKFPKHSYYFFQEIKQVGLKLCSSPPAPSPLLTSMLFLSLLLSSCNLLKLKLLYVQMLLPFFRLWYLTHCLSAAKVDGYNELFLCIRSAFGCYGWQREIYLHLRRRDEGCCWLY